MIKNIIFDLGGVILKGEPKDILNIYELDNETKTKIENNVFANPLWKELDLGNINLEQYFNKIKDNIPNELLDISKQALFEYIEKREMDKDILNIVYRLYENKYNIYILSDNNIETFNYLKDSTLSTYIKGWCVSAVYGKLKITGDLFEPFLEEFNLDSEECILIDDNKEIIKKANSLGMIGILYSGDKKLLHLLENLKEHIEIKKD